MRLAGVERMRELHEVCLGTMDTAKEFLVHVVCERGRQGSTGEAGTIAANLLTLYVLGDHQRAAVDLASELSADSDVTPSRLGDLITRFNRVIETYYGMLEWAVRAGAAFYGYREFFALPAYERLYRQVLDCSQAMRLARARSDLAGLGAALELPRLPSPGSLGRFGL